MVGVRATGDGLEAAGEAAPQRGCVVAAGSGHSVAAVVVHGRRTRQKDARRP